MRHSDMFWLSLVKVVITVESVSTWQMYCTCSPATYGKAIHRHAHLIRHKNLCETWNPPGMSTLPALKLYQTCQLSLSWKTSSDMKNFLRDKKLVQTWNLSDMTGLLLMLVRLGSILSTVSRKTGLWSVHYIRILCWYVFFSTVRLHIWNLYIVIEYEG